MSCRETALNANRGVTDGPAVRKAWFPLIGFLIVLVSTAIQVDCLYNGFVEDDHALIFVPDARGCGANPIDCFRGKVFHFYYRPMLAASFAVVQGYHLHPDTADWYHLENLVLHAVVVVLALWLFRLLLRHRSAALVGGALFALHPVQVSITTFIGGRTDSLALLFVFLYAIGLRKGTELIRVRHRLRIGSGWLAGQAYLWITLSLLALTAAAFTKEQIIGLVLLTPLIARSGARRRRPRRETVGTSAPRNPAPRLIWLSIYGIPIAIYAIACHSVLKDQHVPVAGWSIGLHFEMVGRTIWHFVRILVFPSVSVLHVFTLGSWEVSQPFVAGLGYLTAAGWSFLVIRVWKNNALRILALWTTVTLVPCLNLVPLPALLAAPFRAAIPLFGVAGLAGEALHGLRISLAYRQTATMRRRRIPLTAAILTIALGWYISISIQDVPNYRDDLGLAQLEVDSDANYILARELLAGLWRTAPENGKPDLRKAVEQYTNCINQLFGDGTATAKYAPMYASPNMARVLHSGSLTRCKPDEFIPALFYKRGNTLWGLERYDEAIRDYSVARELAKQGDENVMRLADSFRTAGDTLVARREYQKAAQSYRAGLTLSPGSNALRTALMKANRSSGRTHSAN